MIELAKRGYVQCPLRPPHNLMTLYTLCGQLGRSGEVSGPVLLDTPAAIRAYELMRELITYIGRACLTMDPIAVYELMAQPTSPIVCVPLIYGYVSYATAGFRPARIAFADIPVLNRGAKPVGSALGGTGIAVSAFSPHRPLAVDFAYWVASAEVQRGPYAAGRGQPGHAAAWEDPEVNKPALDFYRNTRATLEGSWVRPRHDGYMHFQQTASEMLQAALEGGQSGAATVAALNRLFRQSFHDVVSSPI